MCCHHIVPKQHAHRWINYRDMPVDQEELLIREGIETFQKASQTGKAPVGWYYGRPSPRSRALLGLELLYNAGEMHHVMVQPCLLIFVLLLV
jgi:peptidoglycan/xylan/chitin deacetylase (PgdA/CDA1 family)